ncbi:Hypothetical predicted protein, partial [Pelobates cultripes]
SEDSLHTATGTRDKEEASKDWYALVASLPKKEDLQSIAQEVKSTLRTEIASLHTSLTDLEGRVAALKSAGLVLHQSHNTDRQHIDLPLHVEDLDNRSRRNNRVRGLRETAGQENLRENLTPLFHTK